MYMSTFEEAITQEAKDLDIESLMSEILGDYSGETNEKTSMSEQDQQLQIRRMIIAMNHLEKEAAHFKNMKKAVAAEWDKRITKKTKQIESIKDYLSYWVNNQNNKEKLVLDVATLTSRRIAPKMDFDASKSQEAVEFFKQHNQFELYTKDPELDSSKVLDAYNKMVEDAAKAKADEILIQMQANGDKITKKKEAEIRKEQHEAMLFEFESKLPNFLKVEEERYTSAVTYNKGFGE